MSAISSRRYWGWVLASLCLFMACGRTLFTPRAQKCVFDSDCSEGLSCINQECGLLELPDGGPLLGKKRFGEPCDAGAQCGSSFCVGGPAGAFCSSPCAAADAGCPSSYTCKRLPNPNQPDGGESVNLCTVPQPLLCQACESDLDCGASGADRCLTSEGGSFCGRDCTFLECPAHYACEEVEVGRAKQCMPEGRTCDCVPATVGLEKSCRGPANAFGRCLGNQTCQADGGFTSCDAPAALAETCNGADDDCNGQIDDFTPPECTKTVGDVTCRGPQVCFATQGLVCTARAPASEACNYEDDDCDGDVDEDFKTSSGYSTLAHCGACNHNCGQVIAHAVSTRCDVSSGAPTCVVSQCEPGYFPYDNNTMCQQLPDTLCSPCQLDKDCVGPGSRCLTIDGAKVCGRDCSPGSAYPPGCPAGYACQPVLGGRAQCVPATGSCSCTAATLGSTRACRIDNGSAVCSGFVTCVTGAGGAVWSSCDVSSVNPEICDAQDNNCNGLVDEGFLNQATGRYEAASHCGFCNNDCTKYFSPTLQHTTGVCDLGPTMPRCAMGPCLTETVGSTTFEWVNVNGETADGCECRRVQGNLTVDLPDRNPGSDSQASWVDENCDGIDGVTSDAIFVSAGAAPGGNGTRTTPFQTIAAGVAAQQAQGKRYVLVAQGLYRENVRLFDGAQIFGGYAQDFLQRDPRLFTTTWQGVAPSGSALAPVHAEGLGGAGAAQETVVSGMVIVGWDASTAAPGADGEASIGVFLRDVGALFVLENNDILAGRGGNGGRGATGSQGFGRQSSGALNGQRGQDSNHFSGGSCTSGNHRAGGLGGSNGSCGGAQGEAGASVVCPAYTMATHQGAQQQYVSPTPSSRTGLGGYDWTFDDQSGGGCGHVTESGFPSSIQPHDGADGRPGADGVGGVGGAGAARVARLGSFVGGRWVASPARAQSGQPGLTAEGGGGGGAGGGVARWIGGGCAGWEIGASGGGAGAGGCGGTGGNPGGAGGLSVAVLMMQGSGSTARPTIRNNRIQRGVGGSGGEGGFGGAGGLGGAGGVGGEADRWSSSVGGKGGEGGNGGPGGGGGGGAGGPSFAVMAFNVALGDVASINSFLTVDTQDTGGPGGAGGSSPGPTTSSGTGGFRGASANTIEIADCSMTCAGSCDANGVCIPN